VPDGGDSEAIARGYMTIARTARHIADNTIEAERNQTACGSSCGQQNITARPEARPGRTALGLPKWTSTYP